MHALPPNASLQDYYAADMHGETMPEELVTRLAFARLPGVENLAPKLCVETSTSGQEITVTGILPRSEYQAKSAWQGLGMLPGAVGSDRGCCSSSASSLAGSDDPNSLATERTIKDLGAREVVLGGHAAESLALKVGDENVSVEPLPTLLATGLVTATLVAVLASFLPARRAAGMDPCLVFNDA